MFVFFSHNACISYCVGFGILIKRGCYEVRRNLANKNEQNGVICSETEETVVTCTDRH